MATIYISHISKDAKKAASIAKELRAMGHEVLSDSIAERSTWENLILEVLDKVDGVVFLITTDTKESNWYLSPMNVIRNYADLIEDKFVLPLLMGDFADLSTAALAYSMISVTSGDTRDAALAINSAIANHQNRIQSNKAKQEKIESNASEYVQAALEKLTEREKANKYTGTVWYVVGFICLLLGLILSVISFRELTDSETLTKGIEVTLLVIIVVKAIIIVGLLIACSKYSFTLGKTYLNESLKNADRSHAIAFGKFYLDAYGATAKWAELKEAFQYWNINNESSFTKLDPHHYDPKFIEQITSIYKMIKDDSK